MFVSISFSFSLHPPCCGRVCVYHLNGCKTSYYRRGVWHSCPTTRNEAVGMTGKGNVAGFLYLQYLQINLYIYICIVPPLGAFKSQLGGRMVYRCCLKPSTSTVIIYLLHIYIYLGPSPRVMLLRWCFFARLMLSTATFATTVLIKCVCLYVCVYVCVCVCVCFMNVYVCVCMCM